MMKTVVKILCCAALLTQYATAEVVDISTTELLVSQPSLTFGDWIFTLANPTPSLEYGLNLIPPFFESSSPEDFLVSNSCCAGDFQLQRLDGREFDLLSIYSAGEGMAIVGGVLVGEPGSRNFQTHTFAAEPGVTNVTTILFSLGDPYAFIQLSQFEVATVPEPRCFSLVVIAAIGFSTFRRVN